MERIQDLGVESEHNSSLEDALAEVGVGHINAVDMLNYFHGV